MTIPLESGRSWRRLLEEDGIPDSVKSANQGRWLVVDDDPAVSAYFKWSPSETDNTSMYSIGFERIAYSLAKILDLPVPDTHLETFDGQAGVLTLRMPGGKTWFECETDIKDAKPTFLDRDRWPLYVAFDVLLGNPDRYLTNVFVQWDPPGRVDAEGEVCAIWLFDFGFGGLFPPIKFGADALEDVDPNADYAPIGLDYMNKRLLPAFRLAFPPVGDAERMAVVEKLRQISEDDIREAVLEVPETYITKKAAALTIELLISRLARADILLDTVFP